MKCVLLGIPVVGLLLAGCAGSPAEVAAQCETARKAVSTAETGLATAQALAVGVDFSAKHQAMADKAVADATVVLSNAKLLVATLCPGA